MRNVYTLRDTDNSIHNTQLRVSSLLEHIHELIKRVDAIEAHLRLTQQPPEHISDSPTPSAARRAGFDAES